MWMPDGMGVISRSGDNGGEVGGMLLSDPCPWQTRDAVEFAYTITGHRGLTTIDDDICRLLVDTGTDDEGRINAKMLATIIKVEAWWRHDGGVMEA